MQNIIDYIFETGAIKIADEGKMFWYTSGNMGPFYVNTHFLYGSEEKAKDLLIKIDKEKENKLTCPNILFKDIYENYMFDNIFKFTIDWLIELIENNVNIDEIDYISGGERRDWIFSLPIAKILNKPHITIFKDLNAVITDVNDITAECNEIPNGSKVLHIADLITSASSYKRAWIPVIKRLGGKILWSAVIIDRLQSGREYLESEDIVSLNLADVDGNLFKRATDEGYISKEQANVAQNYILNPDKTVEEFLIKYPSFIEDSLNGDSKSQEKAELFIKNNMNK